jgi:hypothetical protein
MSPVDVRVPITTRSSEMIDGADLPGRRVGVGSGKLPEGGFELPLLPLENISPRIEELGGIANHVIEPNLVVEMWSGAAAA